MVTTVSYWKVIVAIRTHFVDVASPPYFGHHHEQPAPSPLLTIVDHCYVIYPNHRLSCATAIERRSALTPDECRQLCTGLDRLCASAVFNANPLGASSICDLYTEGPLVPAYAGRSVIGTYGQAPFSFLPFRRVGEWIGVTLSACK